MLKKDATAPKNKYKYIHGASIALPAICTEMLLYVCIQCVCTYAYFHKYTFCINAKSIDIYLFCLFFTLNHKYFKINNAKSSLTTERLIST